MADFGFCGDAYSAPSIYQDDQELINYYVEIDSRKDPDERGYIALYPTPGYDYAAKLATVSKVVSTTTTVTQTNEAVYIGTTEPVPAFTPAMATIDPSTGWIWTIEPQVNAATLNVSVVSDIGRITIAAMSPPLTPLTTFTPSGNGVVAVGGGEVWVIGQQFADNRCYAFIFSTGVANPDGTAAVVPVFITMAVIAGITYPAAFAYNSSDSELWIASGFSTSAPTLIHSVNPATRSRIVTIDPLDHGLPTYVVTGTSYAIVAKTGGVANVLIYDISANTLLHALTVPALTNGKTFDYDPVRAKIIAIDGSMSYSLIDAISGVVTTHALSAVGPAPSPPPSTHIAAVTYFAATEKYVFGAASTPTLGSTLYIVDAATLVIEQTWTYETGSSTLLINPLLTPPSGAYVVSFDPTHAKRLTFAGTTTITTSTTTLVPALGEVRALRTLPGGNVLMAIAGPTLYTLDPSFIPTVRGTLLSSSGPASISDNGIEAMIVDGANRYSYDIATGILTTIGGGDGPFTGGARVDIVDNFLIYNKAGTKQWAATDALSTVTQALSTASTFGSSDKLVTLIVSGREVFLVGEFTTEVWVNTGGFPFPFQIIPGTSSQHGCAAARSISRLGESFAILAQDSRGQAIVAQMVGYAYKRISTHAVENDIKGGVISDAIGLTYQIEGHEFYVLTFPTQDKTWVFDISSNKWHKWLAVDAQNVFHRHRANCAAVFQGQIIVGDYQYAALYALDNGIFTEAGNPIRRVRRCPHIVSDFKRVFYEELQIQFQPGVGLTTGQGSDPQAMLSWSDDGGSTWSNVHAESIGKTGEYQNRARWTQLGEARDRIFEVAITDPVYAPIISANLIATGSAH